MANTLNLGNGNWATKEDSLLAYNSENGNFKPLPFDFTRASSATVVNKAGLIETVGSGEPRIDFSNDAKGALLLEPTRSNLIPYSEDFSQWATNATITPNSAISPDGTQNATLFSHSGGSFPQVIISGITFVSGANYIPSLYVKSDGTSQVQHSLLVNNVVVNFTPTDEWVRISDLIVSPDTSGSFVIAQNSGSSVPASFYIYGAQLEQGSYITSYIPTSGSAVTRLADACNNSANAQVINSTEGVLYAQISALSNSVDTYRLISLNNGSGTNTNRIFIGYTNNNAIYATINNTTIAITSSSFDVKNFNKVAVVYNGSIAKLFINGSEVGSGITNASTLSGLSRVDFSGSSNGANEFKGNTKDIRVYTTALTDAELQALTQ